MQDVIKQEIEWCNKHGGESGKDEKFEIGFVAGLKQALYLVGIVESQTKSKGNRGFEFAFKGAMAGWQKESQAAQHRLHLTAFGVGMLAFFAGFSICWLAFVR